MFNNSIIISDFNTYRKSLDKSYLYYDRVINIKFIRDDGSSFVLRSDYEPVYVGNGKYTFTKCIQKPEIKVQYRKATQSVSIQINIDVTNLHISSAADATDPTQVPYKFVTNKIVRVVLQLGYFNMFPRFDDPLQKLTAEMYNELKSQTTKNDYEEIDCTVHAVYPIKMPPDGITRFVCVVGSSAETFPTTQDDADNTTTFDATSAKIDKYFYEYITRRYARKAIPTVEKIIDPLGSGTIVPEGSQERYVYNGRLATKTADTYGVKVYVTDALKASAFKGTPLIPAPVMHKEISATLMEIQNAVCTDVRFYFLASGNLVAFSNMLDNAKTIYFSLKNQKLEPEDQTTENELPAIYSITYAGLRSIKCPFFPFVRPFQKIDFSSKYNIGSLVGYFYSPKPGEESFIVINYTVDFSTVGNENEMELLSTDYEQEG